MRTGNMNIWEAIWFSFTHFKYIIYAVKFNNSIKTYKKLQSVKNTHNLLCKHACTVQKNRYSILQLNNTCA